MMHAHLSSRVLSRHRRGWRTIRMPAVPAMVFCVIACLVSVVSAQSPATPDPRLTTSGTSGEDQTLTDGIAAVVNTEIITVSELQTEMGDEFFRLKARYEGDELAERLSRKRHEVLNRMIERKLLVQEARAKNILVSDEEVEQVWEQTRSNPAGFPPTATQSKAVLREELMARRVRDIEVRRGIVVVPKEVRTYFQEQQQRFTSPGTHHIRQILLLPKLDETRETLKTRAEVLMSQLEEGTSFEKLAELFSDGSESVMGGDLGFVTKDELLAPLGEALDKLNPGEVSPLIETEIGIHILQLEENRPGITEPFENVKDAIGNQLFQEKIQESHDNWMSSLKDRAYIEIRF